MCVASPGRDRARYIGGGEIGLTLAKKNEASWEGLFDAEGIEGYLGMCRLLGPGHRVRRLDIMSFRASTFACSTLVRLPFSAARVC